MVDCFPDIGHAPTRQGPVQPGPPNRTVVGLTTPAVVEPSRRLIKRAGADRQVGLAETDPFIGWSRLACLIEEGTDHLDRGAGAVLLDVQAEQADGRLRISFTRACQVVPA